MLGQHRRPVLGDDARGSSAPSANARRIPRAPASSARRDRSARSAPRRESGERAGQRRRLARRQRTAASAAPASTSCASSRRRRSGGTAGGTSSAAVLASPIGQLLGVEIADRHQARQQQRAAVARAQERLAQARTARRVGSRTVMRARASGIAAGARQNPGDQRVEKRQLRRRWCRTPCRSALDALRWRGGARPAARPRGVPTWYHSPSWTMP